jgi:hypothetical protein
MEFKILGHVQTVTLKTLSLVVAAITLQSGRTESQRF